MSLTQKLSTCEGVSVLLGTFKKISTQNFSILKIFLFLFQKKMTLVPLEIKLKKLIMNFISY